MATIYEAPTTKPGYATLAAKRDQWALLLKDLPTGADRPDRAAMRALKATIEDALAQPGDVLRITLPAADASRVLRAVELAG